ncbi:KR domain-containing protein [Boeremia exigua]|uniref:KR domain-containing protein n=1 Tax=Boeremia exigua TaxID=749465 RepID=UPI001E8CD879|nr:KR domain-containing protein [Boeremia exigua]KAH6625508.1 KR domain-containing protein [Boeremia exigua]
MTTRPSPDPFIQIAMNGNKSLVDEHSEKTFFKTIWEPCLSLTDSEDRQSRIVHQGLTAHETSEALSSAGKINQDGHNLDVFIFESPRKTAQLAQFADALACQLQDRSFKTKKIEWDSDFDMMDIEGKQCVFLLDYSAPLLADLDEHGFHLLKQVVLTASEIVWACPSNHAETGLIRGFSRVIRNEVPGLRFVTVATESPLPATYIETARTIASLVNSKTSDAEFTIQDGAIRVPRIYEDTALNEAMTNTSRHVELSHDRTYLLAGGLGGVGRSLSRLLVARGARNLCFLSRSGVCSPGATALVTELESQGVSIQVIPADIGDLQSCKSALELCHERMPPLAGVIHAGMVLRDVLWKKMTFQQWRESLNPKVSGTRNLDELLPKALDFFIILSSCFGIFGVRGQANYASACAYQDEVAWARHRAGRKATSLDLGMIADVGVLAENPVPKPVRAWMDVYGIPEDNLHLIIEFVIQCQLSEDWYKYPPQMITGLATGDKAYTSGVSPSYLKDAPFSQLARRSGIL